MRGAILAGVLFAAACADGGAGVARDGKVRVTATTGMVADLARVVGGPRVEVDALMGPGVDPHLYKAGVRDLDRLEAADLVLYSGLSLEGKLQDVFVRMARKGKQVVPVTEDLPEERLLSPEELAGHWDPHVWFDVALWARTADTVAEALGRVDPSHRDEYAGRAARYRAQLEALDEEVRRALATVPPERRVLLTSHDAFRYFGRAYGMDVRGLQGISTVQDAGVRDIQDMAELIVTRGIKAIFVETSVNRRAIEAVQEAVRSRGGAVTIGGALYSDAMGDRPPEDTYVGMVRANVKTIVEALR